MRIHRQTLATGRSMWISLYISCIRTLDNNVATSIFINMNSCCILLRLHFTTSCGLEAKARTPQFLFVLDSLPSGNMNEHLISSRPLPAPSVVEGLVWFSVFQRQVQDMPLFKESFSLIYGNILIFQ